MSQFDDLMATLNAIDAETPDVMAKALPKDDKGDTKEEGDDKKIAEASGEGKPETEAESDYEKEEEDTDDEGEAMEKGGSCGSMKKSFENEDGEEVIDATEILEGLQKSYEIHEEMLAKAMPKVVELLGQQSKQLKEQGELIKSLQDSIANMGARPSGRKSMVTVLAKSTVATQPAAATAPEAAPVTPQDLMVKANSLFDQKLLTGLQLTKLDVALRNGYVPDADVLAVLANH